MSKMKIEYMDTTYTEVHGTDELTRKGCCDCSTCLLLVLLPTMSTTT